ncbi:unnamed protein product [Lymnaea stagnalis]|uniref:BZIP domain-containing protein n=1 Tax=Lymnaea stagnalis TaxID=6523 RepID=A0AAV2ILJ1_LYMST
MMTSMYPATRQPYFREPPRVYMNSSMAIKQEPADDLMESDCPVDMSLSGHHQNMRGCGLAPSNDHDKGPFYDSYFLALQQQNENHPSSPQRSPDAKHERHAPSNAQHQKHGPDDDGFQIKGSDGKLTVPAMLSKNGRSPGFRVIDLHSISAHQRAKREFVPDEKKDEGYWCKRLKNNDSARRSRVKRKALEKMMETRLLQLQKENIELKHEMAALKKRFGIDEGISSDIDSPNHNRETPMSPSCASSSGQDERADKDDDLDVQSSDDSQFNDDSRVYSMGNVAALNQSLGSAGRYRTHSVASGSSAGTGSRSSFTSSSESRSSGHPDNVMRVDKSGALDLTNDVSNRSTPVRDSSSPEDYSSSSQSERRCGWQNSETGGQQEVSYQSQIRSFPLKCRWKKEMYNAQSVASEEMP